MPHPRDQLRAQAAHQLETDQAAAGQLQNVNMTLEGNVEHIRSELVLPGYQEQQARHQAVYGQLGHGVFDLGSPLGGLLIGPNDNVATVGPSLLGGVEGSAQNQAGPSVLPAEAPDLMSAAQDQDALKAQHAAHVALNNSDQTMFGCLAHEGEDALVSAMRRHGPTGASPGEGEQEWHPMERPFWALLGGVGDDWLWQFYASPAPAPAPWPWPAPLPDPIPDPDPDPPKGGQKQPTQDEIEKAIKELLKGLDARRYPKREAALKKLIEFLVGLKGEGVQFAVWVLTEWMRKQPDNTENQEKLAALLSALARISPGLAALMKLYSHYAGKAKGGPLVAGKLTAAQVAKAWKALLADKFAMGQIMRNPYLRRLLRNVVIGRLTDLPGAIRAADMAASFAHTRSDTAAATKMEQLKASLEKEQKALKALKKKLDAMKRE